ncbi:MAG: MazG nucleotide pyrophosphohydrolase domain-containing protein [Thermoproteota archaeon]
MRELTLKCVQEAMRAAYYERDSKRGLFRTFAWLIEEVGELAEALIKGSSESIKEELADVIAWTLSVANLVGVDVEEALKEKYGDVLKMAACGLMDLGESG